MNIKIFCWKRNASECFSIQWIGKYHRIGTSDINKISLPCFDDKMYIQNNEFDVLALGYYSSLQNNAVTLITIEKDFLVKQIVYKFFL